MARRSNCLSAVSRTERLRLAIALTWLCLLPVGCHPWSSSGPQSIETSMADSAAAKPAAHTISPSPTTTKADVSKSSAATPALAALADPSWIPVNRKTSDVLADFPLPAVRPRTMARVRDFAVGVGIDSSAEPLPADVRSIDRWRHPGIEKLLAQSAESRPDLWRAINSSDPVVATNAAILLAHDGQSAATVPLLRAIRSDRTNPWQRRAAVDALADIHQPSTVEHLRALLDEFGDFSGPGKAHYVAEVHAELVRALIRAESLDPPGETSGEPRLALALGGPSPLPRRQALIGLIDSRLGALPERADRFATDNDPQVRQAALVLLAARQSPEALETIHRAVGDPDDDVRRVAVTALGLIGSAEAIAELKRLAAGQNEALRTEAVAALADLGQDGILASAAKDKSWRVRRVAAAALASPERQLDEGLAEPLALDSSIEVGCQTIDSLNAWPVDRAIPTLLSSLSGSTYGPRKLAAAQLAARWPDGGPFAFDAPAEKRAKAVAELRRRWRSLESRATHAAPIAPQSRLTDDPIDAELASKVAADIAALAEPGISNDNRQQCVDRLIAVGASLPAALDRLLSDGAAPFPECVYRQVLPTAAAEFGLIEQLSSLNVAQRRRAADAIARQFATRRLSLVALQRLAALVTGESDSVVWIGVFSTIAGDARQPAVELAYVVLSHPAPEVRRRACVYLGEHPDARHGPLLVKSLVDENPTVLRAAVQAIGRCGRLDDTRPLERLLAAADHLLRVDVAQSLAEVGAAAGPPALVRLTYDLDPHVRQSAAVAMGAVPDASYVAELTRLLDDRPEVRQAAKVSLAK